VEHVIATQALAGGGGTHRQTQNAPPATRFQPPFRKKILPPAPHEEDGEEDPEEDAGRRVFLEVFEEDPTQAPSDVQVAHFIGFL
jgi:hypothetical protein